MQRLSIATLLALLLTASTGLVTAQQPQADKDWWKHWLKDVQPLLQPDEAKAAKAVAVSDREAFREAFWQRRDPEGASAVNQVRTEVEVRIAKADKRYRDGGGWNDCGRTYLLLGPPDFAKNVVGDRHFAGDDRLRTFVDQEGRLAEYWQYRNNSRLPPSPNAYVFRFDPACQFVGAATVEGVLHTVAASYLRTPR